jgi:glycosyltransferase involved in cell wall biosynthesis
MDWRQQCAVVIPCRNEEAAIGDLVRAVHEVIPTVMVVDDGSTDETVREARGAWADVIVLGSSQGKGAALRAGWKRARDCGFQWVLCMDGDGQHAPADIPAFLSGAERTGASLVIGNRMHETRNMPLVRRVVNRWMSRRLSRMAGRDLPDSQCGFRLIRLEALERIPLSTTHFEIESEQVLAFSAAGERIEFVPIQVIYKSEQSRIHPVRDTLRWFRWRKRWNASAGKKRLRERDDAEKTR